MKPKSYVLSSNNIIKISPITQVCGSSIIYTVLYILKSFLLGVYIFKSWEILVHYLFPLHVFFVVLLQMVDDAIFLSSMFINFCVFHYLMIFWCLLNKFLGLIFLFTHLFCGSINSVNLSTICDFKNIFILL